MQGGGLSWEHCDPLPSVVWKLGAEIPLLYFFPGPLVEWGLHLLTLSRWEAFTLMIVVLVTCLTWN